MTTMKKAEKVIIKSKSKKLDKIVNEFAFSKKQIAYWEKKKTEEAKEIKKLVKLNTTTETLSGKLVDFLETENRYFSADAKQVLKKKLTKEQFWTIFNPVIKELKKVFTDIEITVLADLISYGEKLVVK